MAKKNWIQSAIKHPGALRKTLHAKAGKNLSHAQLMHAAQKKGVTGQRARLAMTLGKLRKK